MFFLPAELNDCWNLFFKIQFNSCGKLVVESCIRAYYSGEGYWFFSVCVENIIGNSNT